MLILIAKDLGPAPAQLPRQDNSNVDLVLISRNKEAEFETKDSSNPEQVYTETKHLLFTIIKALPSLSEEADIKGVLVAAQKHAREKNDASLGEKIKKIVQNCRKLVDAGIITEQDNFSKLRKDLVEELINYEGQIKKTNLEIVKLKEVLNNIQEHNKFLEQQYEAYKVYLSNVREQVTNKNNEKAKNSTVKTKGPFKFSHTKLMQDKIIMESEVPDERRANIFFSFAEAEGSPGSFLITVLYKSRKISEMKVVLDDLLDRQQHNQLELETEFLVLNVNLLVHLLNKHFMK